MEMVNESKHEKLNENQRENIPERGNRKGDS
jgi:hypothetical protein